MNQQHTLSETILEKKQRRMSRSYCPICGLKNTLAIDSWGYWDIRLCISCAKEQGFAIDIIKSEKCLQCGELFIPVKSKICPVCWVKKFESEVKRCLKKN